MGYASDVQTARVAAQKTVNTAAPAAVAATHAQIGRLAALEVKIGELKQLAVQIQAAGGLADTASNNDLLALIASL